MYFTVKAKCIGPYAVKLGDGRVTRYEEMALMRFRPIDSFILVNTRTNKTHHDYAPLSL